MNFGGFSPTQLSGLVLWLRADLGITLNVGNVSAWADQSGTGDANKNVVQATGARQPPFTASHASFNNKPAIGFTVATDHQLLSAGDWAASLPQPFSTFIVALTNGSATNRYLFDNNHDPTQNFIFRNTGVGALEFGKTVTLPTTADALVPSVVLVEWNGAGSKLYKSAITANTTGDPGSAGSNLTGTSIGNYALGGAGFSWDGFIAEVVIYNSVLSLAARTTVMNYLGARYAITIGA